MGNPVLPISILGPDPQGHSVSTEAAQPREFTPIPGEDVEPVPMIPPEVEMSELGEQRFVQYLDQEISAARSERWDFVNRLARYKEKYRTKFPEFPKDWPIAGSSQIVVPVIKTAVNTLAARIYQTLTAAEPPASLRTKDKDFQDFAFDFEEFFETYLDERAGHPEILDSWTTEVIKLGTGVLEVSTKLDRRAIVEYDHLTGEYRKRPADFYAGPIIYHVPLEDFWIRPAYTDINAAPWCGKEVRLTWSQIKDMAISGDLDPEKIDNIWRYAGEADMNIPATVKKQEEIEKLRPFDRDLFSLHELSVRWDVDGDGNDEELMVYFHQPSRTLLRRKHSGFRKRPWHVGRFISIEHWFYGEGLCEILEHLQEEISTIHNQRIDNATIANLRIILVARLIKGLRPGDRLWSGKVVRVANVKDDVGTLQLGDVYPSTVANEQISQSYVEKVSGASETAAGVARPVTRTTATAQLALLEELNRRFDKTVKGMRRTLRGVYRDMMDLFMKMGTGGLAQEWLGEARGRRLEAFLSLPHDLMLRKVKVQIMATRSTVNREVEFQSQIAVWQLLQQMWQQVLQTAQMTGGVQLVPLLAHEFISAVRPVFKKVMQYADAPDPDKAVSVLTVLERILPAPEDLGGMGAAQGEAQIEALLGQLASGARGLGQSGQDANGTEGNGRVAGVARPSGPTRSTGPGLSY